ncbi:THUMP-like domain-containing protein [Pedobacter endophyticus]|uniref:THUMP-like domain-containing protein n=1 Tax=Pedobacter endophyticus TaxID=2789740 RepID=A0A7S9L1B8_9SPHI|nr:hypothetical protein [Pedobacter endophyticus]QPH40444.1 hypothetical protein IZT61_03945 [Pedobacter endophyticus]
MNKAILAQPVQDYIRLNLNADTNQIALAKSPFDDVSSAELANQILARKKAEKKLPTWFNAQNIYYPSSLSIEQTSSEITAKYKSKLAVSNSLIDVTGGFGVDAFYFASQVQTVSHCEINGDLSEIAQHNAEVLQAENITFKNTDGIEYVKSASAQFGTIYIDPARRAEKGKVFMLKDCTPNVTINLDALLRKTERIIIKTAPLLDISAGLSELKNVSQIHIVSVKNECKELLWIIDRHFNGRTEIVASTLNETEKSLTIGWATLNTETEFASQVAPGDYLYEPDAALLKSGAFNFIGQTYGLKKLDPQTQLYISREINAEFPGRIFLVNEVLSPAELKRLKNPSGNVIVRNYPARADELVKKHKIKPSKSEFFIFTKAHQNNCVIKCSILQYY